MTVAVLVLLAALALLAVDAWAFFGWREAILADDRDTRMRRRAGFRAAARAAASRSASGPDRAGSTTGSDLATAGSGTR
jgi:hypothetical protein